MTKEQALKDMQERCYLCKKDALPTEKECENCYFPIAIKALRKEIPYKDCDACEYSIPVEIETGLWGWEYGNECYSCRWCTELEDNFKERRDPREYE